MDSNNEAKSESDSLETPSTSVGGVTQTAGLQTDATEMQKPPEVSIASPTQPVKAPKKRLSSRVRGLTRRFNLYFIFLIVLLILSGALVFVGAKHNRKEAATTPLTTQNLSQEAIDQLKNTHSTIGDPKQILSVESNAIFAGTVLIRQNLDVAGQIKVSGALNLPGITVAGTSTLDQLQANNLVITGTATVQKALSVSGNGTFGGTLSAAALDINTLKLNGDLQLNRHIDAGGGTPSKSDGSAIGGGGTTSVSGSDTAGTATINTGSSPAAGCFITVNFSQKFNGTPHLSLTPIGSTAASLNYYVNRSATNFSVCSLNPPPAGSSFSFDYIAID